MAEGFILRNSTLVPVFVYEGERIAVEYPDGTTFEVPPNKVHMMLYPAIHQSGEPCHVLLDQSPITRLPLVVLE